jgi:hypothetical protein
VYHKDKLQDKFVVVVVIDRMLVEDNYPVELLVIYLVV